MPTPPVGCGQITWGSFKARGIGDTSEEQILAEIAQAGYEGAPAGAPGARTAAETRALYDRHGLRPAPGYLGGPFWEKERQAELVEQARRYAAYMRALDCDALYVAPGGFDYVTRSGRTRREVAGHVGADDGLSDDEYRQFADTLNLVARATLAEGVRSCFHNHVGTVIETLDEIERLLALVDPALVFLGPDTGHLAWAGADNLEFVRRYAERIKTLHVKDINPAVLAKGRQEGWDYATFSRNGIFTELGAGFVDFPAIFGTLRTAGFDGWIIAETDVTQQPTALESVTISRDYLRGLGL